MYKPPSDNNTSSPINTLDQFRGLAILLVVLLHSTTAIIRTPHADTYNPISNLIYAGSTGVTLFFILSGMLVTRPFLQGLKNKTMPSLTNYAMQRALRILPMYWIVVIASVAYMGAYDQLLPALFFQLEKVNLRLLSPVWWSLAVEVKFYIALPLLFAVLNIRHGGKLLAGIAICWAAAFILVSTNPRYGAFITVTSLTTRAPAFLVGMAIAYWHEYYGKTIAKTFLPTLLGIAAILALSVWLKPMSMAMLAGYRAIHPMEIVVESLLWGVAILCFLVQERSGAKSAVARTLSAPLKFLARISYSLYLLHMPAIVYCLPLNLPDTGKLMAVLLLSSAASTVAYLIIEKPFLKLKERLARTPAFTFKSQLS